MAALALILAFVRVSGVEQRADAFTNQVLQQGAVGDDVIELQARLQYLGFYNGQIDGVFGWGTYWALRNFQYEFGLPIDGVAGWQSKLKLAKASKYDEQFVKNEMNKGGKFTYYGGTSKEKQAAPAPKGNQGGQAAPKQPVATARPVATNTPNGFSTNDIQLMANAVYGEARGEPYTGQVAVAAVILNRLDSATFPNTISGEIGRAHV